MRIYKARLENNRNLEDKVLAFYMRMQRHIEEIEIFEVKDKKKTKHWLEYMELYFDIKKELI